MNNIYLRSPLKLLILTGGMYQAASEQSVFEVDLSDPDKGQIVTARLELRTLKKCQALWDVEVQARTINEPVTGLSRLINVHREQ